MICIPENNPTLRFILGRKGTNNLLVVCLNPSTATGDKHDGTTDNIDKIAKVNGYDGWVLFNLSPQRTPHPHLLDTVADELSLSKNREALNEVVQDIDWGIKNVWFAWGNNISGKTYLKEQASLILANLGKFNLNYWHIKNTRKGHPFHPSKQSVNRFIGPVEDIILKKFDLSSYSKELQKDKISK